MKRFGGALLWIIGAYFVVRAIAEPFVIDLNDPATYRHDWGGPRLAGVLLLHCGLGIVAASLMAWRVMRKSAARGRRGPNGGAGKPRTGRAPKAAKRASRGRARFRRPGGSARRKSDPSSLERRANRGRATSSAGVG